VLSIATQPPNSLLHDGHRWKASAPTRIRAAARDALRVAARRRADFVVHASYAFLRAVEQGCDPHADLQRIVDAALDAEDIVLGGRIPACVVRVGYLYGPDSDDLRAYRDAFLIGRPYWAGPSRRLQHFVHTEDAARALLTAARRRPDGRVLYATDERPVSFGTFMDHFARLSGNRLPLHLPSLSKPVSRIVVGEMHMHMVELGVRGKAAPHVPGWRAQFPTYRSGLADVVSRLD